MPALCPAQGPDDPLVRSLLGIVDCNVQGLVRGGYATLFEPSSAFSAILTSLLTIYVAILGYRLLLGRTQLRIGELALTAVKIGAILALTTGWATYQTVVYNFLFRGPAELAGAMLVGVQPQGSLFRGDVFDGLQAVFDALNAFATAFTQHTASQPALPGAPAVGNGFGAQGLTVAAMTLLLSTLGVLLAIKMVLGLLLAVGPIFIALMLFQTTRGLFEGWLRASLAFALAPLAITVILGVDLTVLEPFLLRLRDQLAQKDYSTAPVYALLILVLVFAAVSALTLVAGGVIALGLRLPRFRDAPGAFVAAGGGQSVLVAQAAPSRAERVAAA
nr:type IV secretion system protein [Caulobacteraceae bacterium]